VINSGVSWNSVPEPVLYLLYMQIFQSLWTTATYADNIAILVAYNNHIEAFKRKSLLYSDVAKESKLIGQN